MLHISDFSKHSRVSRFARRKAAQPFRDVLYEDNLGNIALVSCRIFREHDYYVITKKICSMESEKNVPPRIEVQRNPERNNLDIMRSTTIGWRGLLRGNGDSSER